MDEFITIAITDPAFIPNEGELITLVLNEGVDFVHLRKPEATEEEMERLILSVAPSLRSRMRLHSHFPLIEKYGLAGAHLNSRYPVYDGSVSKSCHSLEEVNAAYDCCYVTLSPVFDSISKPGYRAAAFPPSLPTQIRRRCVIALGGIVPENFPILAAAGYSGAAMLGYLWKDADRDTLRVRCREIRSAVANIKI